jgi:hypothetical protein
VATIFVRRGLFGDGITISALDYTGFVSDSGILATQKKNNNRNFGRQPSLQHNNS